jgi:hypothetical protein
MFDFSKRLEDFETGKPTGGRGARGKYNREERAPRSGGFQVVVVVNARPLALVTLQVVMVVLLLIVLPLVVNEKLLVLQHVVVSVVAGVQVLADVAHRLVVVVVVVSVVDHAVVAQVADVVSLLNRATNSICLLQRMNQVNSNSLLMK